MVKKKSWRRETEDFLGLNFGFRPVSHRGPEALSI